MKADPPNRQATARQVEVLRLIAAAILTGRPPTVREIGEELGIRSASGMAYNLEALESKGYITRDEDIKARNIRLEGATLRLEYDDTPAGRRLRDALEGGEP